MNRVAEILRGRSGEVVRVGSVSSAHDAITAMIDANAGYLLVVDDGHLAGIVTERDYLRFLALRGSAEARPSIGDIMSPPVVCVSPEASVEECLALLTESQIWHAPVVEDGVLLGVITICDLLEFRSTQQDAQIRFLNDYITTR